MKITGITLMAILFVGALLTLLIGQAVAQETRGEYEDNRQRQEQTLPNTQGDSPGTQQPEGISPGTQRRDGISPDTQQPHGISPGTQRPDGLSPGTQQPDTISPDTQRIPDSQGQGKEPR